MLETCSRRPRPTSPRHTDRAFGPAIAAESLVRLDMPEPRAAPGVLEASVAMLDAFGSAQLLAELADLETALGPVAPATPRHRSG